METFKRRHQTSLIADFYQWVGQRTEKNALIIAIDDATFISHYSHRKYISRPFVARHLMDEAVARFLFKIDQALEKGVPVYMTLLVWDSYVFHEEFRNFMKHNYHLTLFDIKPLELWYNTPFDSYVYMSGLLKVERKK